jgi:ABC-2 type transport system permease protein
MFGGGFLVLAITNRTSTTNQRIAVVDHTGVSAAAVIQACEEAIRRPSPNAPTGLRVTPHYVFEEIKPEADQADQLLSLSNRIRTGELFLVLDIGADKDADKDKDPVHYYTNSSGVNQLGLWLPAAVNDGLRRVRLAQLGVNPASIPEAMREVDVVSMNLVMKDPVTGKIVQGEKRNPVEMAMPFFLVFLLIMVVMIGSAPHIGAVAEDKMQRVFEMLLVSASSFDLMMGKVLAALGASLTSSTLYIVGGLMVLSGMALFGLAPLNLLPWFFVYLIADVIILSALGVALGSACGSAQDAQQLAFLLFLPVVIPMLTVSPIMAQPNGAFATAISFIPPFTPVLMLLRQAMPGGVPWWQPWLGLVGVAVFAYCAIWAAARIFRIGILSQGKAPKLAELAQWVARG